MIPLPYNKSAISQIHYAYAKQHQLLCLNQEGKTWKIAFGPKTPEFAIQELIRSLAAPIEWVYCEDEPHLVQTINQAYSSQESHAATIADEVAGELNLTQLMQEIPNIEDLLEAENDAPIIRMINALLTQASKDNASDIHIEPFETHSCVRLRIDGTLRELLQPKRELHAALISRIKIMANLDIAEKRLPQDGRITLRIGGRPIDVRVSTLPTAHGERAVLRLLNKQNGRLDLKQLGMPNDILTRVHEICHLPHGILLVTGPTGSGKTTTLYAALSRIHADKTNIMTVEDPVEYDLPGISQIPVNSKIDMTFAKALRAILRQDPDVIMIGEIRDFETAQIAVQASLTGHLVLATLHTNDSISAVTRLTDMGVEPYLLSSSLLGVLAQRLVRLLCSSCKFQTENTANEPIWQAKGCERCAHTGYSGRTGIYEFFNVDESTRHRIHEQQDEAVLRKSLRMKGMQSMYDNGLDLIAAGLTTMEELLRVTKD